MKAIILLSGGLDSTLAAKMMLDLGVELVAFNTVSPFCLCARHSSKGCFHSASIISEKLGIRIVSCNTGEEFLEIVRNPRHGYGSHINPCIDCRILLFRKAKELMACEQAAFIVTGEVLGQRPMSQHKRAMRLIDEESGLSGYVVRPLSANILEASIPEERGWVPREKLLAISGRGRRAQMQMAQEYGINDYPCPAGGCLLTDPAYSKRVRDLLEHNELTTVNVRLLRVGRHFRLNRGLKLVVGRDEKENEQLLKLANPDDYLLQPVDIAGPVALARGVAEAVSLRFAASLLAGYCDGDAQIVKIASGKSGGAAELLEIPRISPAADAAKYRI